MDGMCLIIIVVILYINSGYSISQETAPTVE